MLLSHRSKQVVDEGKNEIQIHSGIVMVTPMMCVEPLEERCLRDPAVRSSMHRLMEVEVHRAEYSSGDGYGAGEHERAGKNPAWERQNQSDHEPVNQNLSYAHDR